MFIVLITLVLLILIFLSHTVRFFVQAVALVDVLFIVILTRCVLVFIIVYAVFVFLWSIVVEPMRVLFVGDGTRRWFCYAHCSSAAPAVTDRSVVAMVDSGTVGAAQSALLDRQTIRLRAGVVTRGMRVGCLITLHSVCSCGKRSGAIGRSRSSAGKSRLSGWNRRGGVVGNDRKRRGGVNLRRSPRVRERVGARVRSGRLLARSFGKTGHRTGTTGRIGV